MTVESMKSLFDLVAVILVFGAFVVGAGALYTGNIINDRQAERLRRFDIDLRDKDIKITEANARTVDLQSKIMPRDLTMAQQKAIGIACANFAGRHVQVTADSPDPEAWLLADLIKEALQKYAGIEAIRPLSEGLTWAGEGGGITVGGADAELVRALKQALETIGNLNVKEDPEIKTTGVTVALGVRPFVRSK